MAPPGDLRLARRPLIYTHLIAMSSAIALRTLMTSPQGLAGPERGLERATTPAPSGEGYRGALNSRKLKLKLLQVGHVKELPRAGSRAQQRPCASGSLSRLLDSNSCLGSAPTPFIASADCSTNSCRLVSLTNTAKATHPTPSPLPRTG